MYVILYEYPIGLSVLTDIKIESVSLDASKLKINGNLLDIDSSLESNIVEMNDVLLFENKSDCYAIIMLCERFGCEISRFDIASVCI